MKKTLKVAVVQLCSTESVEKNIQQILHQLIQVKKHKVDLAVLPENSLFLKVGPKSPIQYFNLKEAFWAQFKKWAKASKSRLIFGSVPLAYKNKKFNAMVEVTAQSVKVIYKKIHLFDVDVAGQPSLRESDNFDAGTEPQVLDVKGFRLGLSICYDIRFSELYSKYAQKKVDALLIPSAFLVETGRDHWHVLNRARAIESQCYVLSAAQSGHHKKEGQIRKTYGHSICVDPWGRILKESRKKGPDLFVVELSSEEILKVRRQIPMADHRCL